MHISGDHQHHRKCNKLHVLSVKKWKSVALDNQFLMSPAFVYSFYSFTALIFMSLTEIFPLFHTTLWEFIHHLHPVPQTVLKKWPKKIIFKITSSLRYNKHFNHVVSGNIEEVNVVWFISLFVVSKCLIRICLAIWNMLVCRQSERQTRTKKSVTSFRGVRNWS